MQILAIRFVNTVFVQHAHLDKCPPYKAQNHLMAPCQMHHTFMERTETPSQVTAER